MNRPRRMSSPFAHAFLCPLLTLLGVFTPGAAAAHDFFLLPQSYLSEQPTIEVDATISAAFPALELTVAADRIASLQALSPSTASRAEITGPAEKSLRLRLLDAGKGISVVVVRTVPREVDYAEDRIGGIMSEYDVAQDAIDAVGALQHPRTLRVLSTRTAKAHVCILDCSDRTATIRTIGSGLEFVAASAGDDARFRLIFNGSPMANHPIVVASADGARRRGRTDGMGRVALTEADRGVLMLFAAHMRPPPGPSDRFELQLTSLTLARR